MYKSLYPLSIILLVAYLSKTEEAKTKQPPIDQDLPLVLINTNRGLQLPREVIMKTTGALNEKKMIRFSLYEYVSQEFYCPSEDEEQRYEIAKAIEMQNQAKDLIKEKIDEHCLMRKKQTDEIPAPQCQREPHPKIMKAVELHKTASTEDNETIPSSTEIPCGSSGEGKMLGFGYQVCIEHEHKGWGNMLRIFQEKAKVHPIKSTKEVVFYNLCYSAATNEILFTTNTTKGSPLFYSKILENDTKKTWPLQAYNSIHMPNIKFEQVQSKFEQVTQSSNFKIQLLVNPDDNVMGLWKKPAYHYANASLIHEELQQCWNVIHERIQRYAWKIPFLFLPWDYVNVFTGAFKLPDTGTPKIINDVQIPKIWVKMVYSSFTVAIIANNYRDEDVDKIITEKLNCKVNLCKKFIENNFANVFDHVRCCALTDEIQALFGTTLESIGILEIKGVIVDETKKSNPTYFAAPYESSMGTQIGLAASYGITGYAVGDTFGSIFS